jgi:BMFP domain-containing protein YqiC
MAVLKEEAAWLREELNAVEQRIHELESSQTEEE